MDCKIYIFLIIQCEFLDFCFRFHYSQLKNTYVPVIQITDSYMLCKWEILQDLQCMKYFSPLYIYLQKEEWILIHNELL